MPFTIIPDDAATQVRATLRTPHDFNQLIEKLIGKRDELVKQIEAVQSSDEPLPARENFKTGDTK